jgi:predicted dehydrogenase
MLYGHAWIEERREIPYQHFALWIEHSSPFEYIGVHYVDAYYYITGLRPKRVAAFGQQKLLKSRGKNAFDAVQAVIEWEDSSTLWVQTSWVLSQNQSALTSQGLMLHGTEGEYWADHKDRNCRFVTEKSGYEDFNPNFFRTFDSWDPDTDADVWGYGYESIVQGIRDIAAMQNEAVGLGASEALSVRRTFLQKLAPKRALPEQALIGTAVNEAVRLSLGNGNAYVRFDEQMQPFVAR